MKKNLVMGIHTSSQQVCLDIGSATIQEWRVFEWQLIWSLVPLEISVSDIVHIHMWRVVLNYSKMLHDSLNICTYQKVVWKSLIFSDLPMLTSIPQSQHYEYQHMDILGKNVVEQMNQNVTELCIALPGYLVNIIHRHSP